MSIIPSLPYNIQNLTPADATQVMADFNEIVDDVNANAATNGANSDITSLSGLTTPLSLGQGGTGAATAAGARTNLGLGAAAVENLGGAIIDSGGNLTIAPDAVTLAMMANMDANSIMLNNTGSPANPIYGTVAQLVAMLGLAKGSSVRTTSGTFTTPANTTLDTVFEFTITGAGGGGGGVNAASGGGGGAGSTGVYIVTGLTANLACAVVIGAAGTGGSSSGGDGGTGGSSTVTVSATTVTAPGGLGGPGASSSGSYMGGAGGGACTNATLSIPGGGGGAGMLNGFAVGSGVGGSSFWGGGGRSTYFVAADDGQAYGSGGGGAHGTSVVGGAGKAGVFRARWW